MALPRTKVELQNAWVAWLDQRAIDDGLTDVEKGELKTQLAREVNWMIWSLNLETDLQGRLDKYDDLLAAHEGNLSTFDVWWTQRRDFLLWMQT